MNVDLEGLVADSQDRVLPSLVTRSAPPRRAPGTAVAVIGMRRTGKTWFCFQLMQELLAAGVERERILYLNFEDERLASFRVDDFQRLLDAFHRRHPRTVDEECHFFFDEIQQVDGWPRFVRRLLDENRAQVTLTGSSARMLSAEIHTSLRGRGLPCEIFPFSFAEFATARGVTVPAAAPTARERVRLQALCDEYLVTGGFPGVVDLDGPTRRQMLQQYLDVVILRDVIERHGVTSVPALRALVRHLVHAPSCRLSINKVYKDFRSRGLACSKNNLHAFVDHLSDAYLLHPVPIHTRSERVRQVNPAKAYLVDTGLLAAASSDITADRGALLENLVFLHLRRAGDIIEYFHDRAGIETDFVVRDPLSGAVKDLVQVTASLASPETRRRELRGLRAAMEALGRDRGTVIVGDDAVTTIDEPGIEVVPAWRYLLSI